MGAQDVGFACSCGTVQGRLSGLTPKTGDQLRCHCADCRRAVIWLGQPDPGPGGVGYLQTTPAHVSFNGAALKAFIWKNKRLMRWYAPCCNTHMFNTLDSAKWPFASFNMNTLQAPSPLGDVTVHGFQDTSDGAPKHIRMGGFMWRFAKRALRARLTGTWRDTPFFERSGKPKAPVQTLTRSDRATARL